MHITIQLSVISGGRGENIQSHSLSVELAYWIPLRWILAGFFKFIILCVLFLDLETLFFLAEKKVGSFKLLTVDLDIVCSSFVIRFIMAKSNSPISLFWMLPDSTSIFCERLWPIKVTLISRRTESSWIFPPTSAVLIAGRVIPDSSEFTWHCSVWASLVFTAVKQSCGLTKLQSDLTQRTCSSLSWSLIIPKTVSSATVAILPYLVFFCFCFPRNGEFNEDGAYDKEAGPM